MARHSIDALINIDVPDLDAAIDFYGRATGLRLERRLFDGSVAELSGAAFRVFLLQKVASSCATPDAEVLRDRDYRRHWTPVHLDFVVPDVDAAAEAAIAAGARLEGQIESFAWGRQARFSDPFGHGLCFVQWIGDGYDDVSADRSW